jgi:CBS domain-containing protein
MDRPSGKEQSLVRATASDLRRHAPFDRMDNDHLVFLASRLSLAYYPAQSLILDPSHGIPRQFFIIKQGGVVGGGNSEPATGDSHWRLAAGECFPLGALIGDRSVTSYYRAVEDTFCYQLPAEDFHRLLQSSAVFHDFCTRRLAALLVRSRQSMQSEYMLGASRQPLDSPLADLIRRPPVVCSGATLVRDAARAMREARVGSILIVSAAGDLEGIFTLRDLRDRVVAEGTDTQQPVEVCMSPRPICLPSSALAFEAALAMARHGFHHVVVKDGDVILGVVSESDLFALQRVGVTRIHAGIRSAETVSRLQQLAADIRSLTHSLLAQGVDAEHMMHLISALNDQLTTRVVELECDAAGVPSESFSWIALGSQGRHEQTLATDQDNGILFADESGEPARNRERLLPLAARINAQLAECGFPLCRGEIMARNPRWCLSLGEWKGTFSTWIDRGDPQSLLNAAIFFDFRAVCGNATPVHLLREWLTAAARGNQRFLHQMAENALGNTPPLGILRDFDVATHGSVAASIDLKLNGAMPFVDAARILSLATDDTHTGTVDRLRRAARALGIGGAEAEAWIEAYLFIQALRLRRHHSQIERGQTPDNFLDPNTLNNLDRRILKEALHQARKLQTRIRLDYQL